MEMEFYYLLAKRTKAKDVMACYGKWKTVN